MAFIDKTPMGEFPSLEVFIAAGYPREDYAKVWIDYRRRKTLDPRASWEPPKGHVISQRIMLDGSLEPLDPERFKKNGEPRGKVIAIKLDGSPEHEIAREPWFDESGNLRPIINVDGLPIDYSSKP